MTNDWRGSRKRPSSRRWQPARNARTLLPFPVKSKKVAIPGTDSGALKSLATGAICKNQRDFAKKLDEALEKFRLKLKAPLQKAIIDALSERDETADVVKDDKGNKVPDADLRDFENVPLGEKIDAYMKREVLPYVLDAWVDETKTRIGYEISFNRYFYEYKPPRPVGEIEKDLEKIEEEIAVLLKSKVPQ